MKALVNKRVLVNAVNSAALAVGRRAGLPILRCLKLEVEGGCVTVRATDLAVAVTRYLAGAECDAVNGACAVGAAKLRAALKAMPGPDVGLELKDGGWLRVESGGASLDLATMDAAKFPPIPGPGNDWERCLIPGATLARLIEKTAFCASVDEGRVNVNGGYLERAEVGGEPGVRMVGTDGHRMAIAEAPCEAALPGPMLIPRKALKPLAELAGAERELTLVVKIGEHGQGVSFVATGRADTVTVRLVDKEFPDWTQVVPEGGGPTFMVEADELAAALKAVTALATDRSKAVKFEAGTAGDCIVLSASNCDLEAATQKVRVSGMTRPIPVVGFNAKYLIEALGKAKRGTVEFEFAEHGPALMPIILMDVCDPHWKYVLVPMRITS